MPLELPTPLRAITLWQPYAWALIYAGKDVENRPRSLRVTGWVAVHVGLHRDDDYEFQALCDMPNGIRKVSNETIQEQRGHIIGLVNIERWAPRETLPPSPWLQRPPGVAAVITEAMPLRTPVLCREGFHRGAWRVPEEVERQVRGQL
jgi:hypothetical protein